MGKCGFSFGKLFPDINSEGAFAEMNISERY
jgi:hypothetical protein